MSSFDLALLRDPGGHLRGGAQTGKYDILVIIFHIALDIETADSIFFPCSLLWCDINTFVVSGCSLYAMARPRSCHRRHHPLLTHLRFDCRKWISSLVALQLVGTTLATIR